VDMTRPIKAAVSYNIETENHCFIKKSLRPEFWDVL